MTEPEIVNDEAKAKDKILSARGVIKFVAAHSVRFVVSSAITTLVPVESKKDKARVMVGSYVISGVLNQKVRELVDEDINEALEFFHEVRNQVKTIESTPNS